MSDDEIPPPADARWRLFAAADMVFVYHLITKVDPRWWRFSRHGLEPSQAIATSRGTAAGALVLDGYGAPMACALLVDAGGSKVGTLEYFALPNPAAHELARRFAPDLIRAAFEGAPIERLYYERFENDPDVLGEVGSEFEVEVTYPDFAMVDGTYEARTTAVLTAERFREWLERRGT